MKYVGGKHTISKQLTDFIKSQVNPSEYEFYDLFCGSCGIVKNMQEFKKVIANDIEEDLYLFWKDDFALDFLPNEIEYKLYKHNPNPSQKRCFYRFFLSYGGKSWGGYLERHCNSKRNFFQEFKNSYNKIKPILKDVEFHNKSYLEFDMEGAVIYCDPPYKNTQGYSSPFDTEQFWERMRYLSQKNIVFISCEEHPSDFIVVWKKDKLRTLQRERRIKEELLVQFKK
jgi:DNA adenine methylase